MKYRLFLCMIAFLLAFSLPTVVPVTAQEPEEGMLEPYIAVEGELSPGEEAVWRFRGIEGSVISIYGQPSEGSSLDPTLTLGSTSGGTLVSSDDIAYPGTLDALLQAVTLPRTDTYTVTISAYGETSGGYRLLLTNGYPQVTLTDDFEADTTTWQATADVILDQIIGQLTLSAQGTLTRGYAQPTAATVAANGDESSTAPTEYDDFYVDAELVNVSGRSGWRAGMMLRRTAAVYYAVMVNHQGQWRMIRVDRSGERVLRDWTSHPAIVAGQENFRLGVLANQAAFDVFYNGAFVGQAVDTQQPLLSGEIGLYIETTDNIDSQSQASFENITLTTPLTVGDAEIIPMQLMPGVQSLTIQELERRRVITPGGQTGLNVAESFSQRINPGVSRVLLGRGSTFGDLVISTDLTWQAGGTGVVGCGLVFGSASETDYSLAFIDQSGGYGLASRVEDSFTPGLFAETETAPSGTQNLLVIQQGEQAHFYVNRRYAGQTSLTTGAGEIGVAVVNYESIDTTCRFNNTWVWELAGR